MVGREPRVDRLWKSPKLQGSGIKWTEAELEGQQALGLAQDPTTPTPRSVSCPSILFTARGRLDQLGSGQEKQARSPCPVSPQDDTVTKLGAGWKDKQGTVMQP